MDELLHCGILDEDGIGLKYLCGASINSGAWDYPKFFVKYPPSMPHGDYRMLKCPRCMEHPDLPLLILAKV